MFAKRALKDEEKGPVRIKLGWIAAIMLAAMALSLLLGRYPGPFVTPPSALMHDPLARTLALDLRLPRIIMAVMTGIVLSSSGMVFQMVFRNPLVDSGFLGVTAGASFGACLGIVFLGGHAWSVQSAAAFFGFMGLAFSYVISRRIRFGDWALRLVLSGIAVSAIFTSGSGMLKYIADPLRQLPDITFWMLGGIWGVTWNDVIQVSPIVIVCLTILYVLRWRMNLLSMRDETTFSLGVEAGRERLVLLLAAVLSTSVIMSKTGLVMWVGMIIPHLARRWLGSDAQRSFPGAMFIGGLFVLVCDNIARTLLPGEIPLGILSSAIGAGIFIVIMLGKKVEIAK